MDKVAELIKAGQDQGDQRYARRDRPDGLKLTIDLKRGLDPDKLMPQLFSNPAGGQLQLQLQHAHRRSCPGSGRARDSGGVDRLAQPNACAAASTSICSRARRSCTCCGPEAILLDIDKAIEIIRETEEEAEVVPNLMIGFGIDQVQAEYVAEIKLRNINRSISSSAPRRSRNLEEEIADLEDTLKPPRASADHHGRAGARSPRNTPRPAHRDCVRAADETEPGRGEQVPDYPVTVFFTREGYFKKITPSRLRMSGEQKLKEGDAFPRRWRPPTAPS